MEAEAEEGGRGDGVGGGWAKKAGEREREKD
jgi:hypothetical protein